MNRFFVPPEAISRGFVSFSAEQAAQINKVLRLRLGDEATALDGLGKEYLVGLTKLTKSEAEGEIRRISECTTEASVHLHLYVSLTQREKFELILQKCTEIGVSEFTPVLFARSLVPKSSDFEGKRDRWEKILQEAAEQSGRCIIPRLNDPVKHAAAISGCTGPIKLLAWTQEQSTHLIHKVQSGQSGSAALMIGPEGGMTAEEVALAQSHGWQPVSLGQRILRMETAAMIGSALILAVAESDQSAG